MIERLFFWLLPLTMLRANSEPSRAEGPPLYTSVLVFPWLEHAIFVIPSQRLIELSSIISGFASDFHAHFDTEPST